ncbi:hypothetical protein Tco_0819411 [Tanacetum coccineum]|uniref:Uncharacterized protein n=1 Tax=Tanacetum coccineum TaxID=301880 RepID=A0ABQ5A9K6_9ASTR
MTNFGVSSRCWLAERTVTKTLPISSRDRDKESSGEKDDLLASQNLGRFLGYTTLTNLECSRVLEISGESAIPTSSLNLMIDSRYPSFTPFEGSDFLMEEIDAFLEHDDSIPPGVVFRGKEAFGLVKACTVTPGDTTGLPDCEDSRVAVFTLHAQEFHHPLSFILGIRMDIQEKDKKKAKNKQNRARNGKGKVKSKPKSEKVKKSTGKSTPKKSKVNEEDTLCGTKIAKSQVILQGL